jgi:hypothetical protein
MIHVPYGGNRLEVLSRKYFRLKQRLIFAPGTVSKWYQKKRRAILPRLVAVLSLQHTALFPPRHRRHDGCGCARSARRPADGRLAQRCAPRRWRQRQARSGRAGGSDHAGRCRCASRPRSPGARQCHFAIVDGLVVIHDRPGFGGEHEGAFQGRGSDHQRVDRGANA